MTRLGSGRRRRQQQQSEGKQRAGKGVGDFCFSLCFFALEVNTSHAPGLLMPIAVVVVFCFLAIFFLPKTEVFYSTLGQVKCRNDGNELPAAKTSDLAEYLCMLIVFIRQIN